MVASEDETVVVAVAEVVGLAVRVAVLPNLILLPENDHLCLLKV